MNVKKIGKAIKGMVILVIGGEIYLISQTCYDLYINKTSMAFAGGSIRVPYLWIVEIMAIPIAPILIKLIAKLVSNNKIADDTDLIKLFNKVKKEEDENV